MLPLFLRILRADDVTDYLLNQQQTPLRENQLPIDVSRRRVGVVFQTHRVNARQFSFRFSYLSDYIHYENAATIPQNIVDDVADYLLNQYQNSPIDVFRRRDGVVFQLHKVNDRSGCENAAIIPQNTADDVADYLLNHQQTSPRENWLHEVSGRRVGVVFQTHKIITLARSPSVGSPSYPIIYSYENAANFSPAEYRRSLDDCYIPARADYLLNQWPTSHGETSFRVFDKTCTCCFASPH